MWLLQSVFLEPVYKAVKINDIKSSASLLSRQIDSDQLESVANMLAARYGMCIIIIGGNGRELLSVNVMNNCAIHNINRGSLSSLYFSAKANGGEVLQRFMKDDYRNYYYLIDENRDESGLNDTESIIYTKITFSEMGEEKTIYLNSIITPVKSAVSTMNFLLLFVSVALLIFAMIFALIMSKRISRPITALTSKAKLLAENNYNVDFSDGNGYLESEKLGEMLNYAEKELRKSESLRRELIANISHDLRTPLTMISGYAEVMRDIPGENTPENIQIIIDETNRLTSLVNDVLDISKLQTGTQELNKSVFNFTLTVKNALDRYSKLTGQKGYDISFEYCQEMFVYADETRIMQVIYNLVNNAVAYTGGDKKIIIRQKLYRKEHQSSYNNMLRLEVIDTGGGIPQDKLPFIWDRYYKADKEHKRSQSGSGLGLSIVKSIMNLHGCECGVVSEEGKGAQFWFELPFISGSNMPPEQGNTEAR